MPSNLIKTFVDWRSTMKILSSCGTGSLAWSNRSRLPLRIQRPLNHLFLSEEGSLVTYRAALKGGHFDNAYIIW